MLGIVVGLIAGLVLGVFVGVLVISPSGILPVKAGTGTNNQVQVSGTITPAFGDTVNTLYFKNLNGTFETSTSVVNGQYNVLLLGGQSYNVFDFRPFSTSESIYQPFYVPLGVTTFTENILPNS